MSALKLITRLVVVGCLLLGAVALSIGCTVSESETAINKQDAHNRDLAVEAYKAAGLKGEPTAVVSEMTEDHQITAQFILQQRGMDTDFAAYKSVQVVTLTQPSGQEVLAVILDNERAVMGGGN